MMENNPSSTTDIYEETYREPLAQELALAAKWVIWEQYESAPGNYKKGGSENWMASMQKVAWFDDIVTFWQLWNSLPFSHLERYFFDKENARVPLYDVSFMGHTEQKRISTLAVFQSGIKPMWEDSVNKYGSEMRFMIPLTTD
jgi:Eukaryotic initiation factor 4E